MKKLVYGYIMAFVLIFMLLVYEPILMYATNINDFWFDFNTMIKPVLLIFLVIYLFVILLITLTYLINRWLLKNDKVYSLLLIVLFGVFLVTYIQGNYLIGSLPALDGSAINWNIYVKENIITVIIWTIIIGFLIFAKLKFKSILKYLTLITCAIFVMLLASLGTTLMSREVYVKKENVSTEINFNNISNNKNFLIFLVDSVEMEDFDKVLKENTTFDSVFDDFTFYTDAMSAYGFTRDSIPHILTGKRNKNETSFREYSSNALNDSPLFSNLKNKNYSLNIYDEELIWDNKRFEIGNYSSIKLSELNVLSFFKQEMKYVLYKYLPYFLKSSSKIETMDYSNCVEKFSWKDDLVYSDIISSKKLIKQDKNYFQFVHTEGAHVPWDFDENLNRVGHGSYGQKVSSTIKLIDSYIKRLKENNVYDNSVIVILADHGRGHIESGLDRHNPILLIKGIDEHHELARNNSPIIFDDLQEAFKELLEGKKSKNLFAGIPKKRKRTCLNYKYSKEDHMVEYETEKKANEAAYFKETGNVFDLEEK